MAGIRRIRVIGSSQPAAFTVGYFLPLVVVSDALVRALGDRELEALLRHECQHVNESIAHDYQGQEVADGEGDGLR